MKKGFSFAEMLAAMLIVGIISVVTIPVISRSLGTQHKQLYKAAFQNVDLVVNELVNDTALYPGGEFTTAEDFCTNFSDKVNTIDTIVCDTDPTIPGTPNFITSNGMKWYFDDVTTNDFADTCPDSAGSTCIHVYIDINGGKGSSKWQSSDDDDQRDILGVYVSKTGKIYVPETSEGPERDYLTN